MNLIMNLTKTMLITACVIVALTTITFADEQVKFKLSSDLYNLNFV